MTDTWTVEDDASISLNDEAIISVSSILFEKAKARRTRNDIARDVRSGGAGSDEGTAAPAVALSAR
jgi:hypothetical protein